MDKEIIWSENSLRDRLKIYSFWVDHNKSEIYSEKLEKLFNKSANLIANFPEIGIKTDYKNIRIKIVSHFKIFYLVHPKSITILRIWDSRQYPKNFKI